MKRIVTSLIFTIFMFGISNVEAQSIYGKLIKNNNVRAKNLTHTLNKSKDSLLLSSDKKINYVYTINRDYKKEYYSFIDNYSYSVPLSELSEGKHTFVVGQSPLKIVFAVYVYRDKFADISVKVEESNVTTLD